ncbi:MAG: class I SAM-dependent methyltransferase [Acidobacteriota bacterium]|nr:class I SAM-dependent methyltransferase [Acidobacteriota bacterium]
MTETSDSIDASCSVPCNLCGSKDVAQIARLDRKRRPLRTVICKRCGLVWTDPRPVEEEIVNFYAEDYRLEYKGTYKPRLQHIYRAGRGALERYGQIKELLDPKMSVLDVGSGGGEFVYVMRRLGFDARGIEPNRGYALYAREELGLPIEIGVAQQQEFPAASFDLVTMNHILEHLTDPLSILSRVRGWLREQGWLVIEVPNVEATCQAPLSRFHTAHLYNFNRRTLETMGLKAGFNVYRTSLSSDGGVVMTIFRKAASTPNLSGEIPSNYERISETLKRHTLLGHYFSSHPYKRPLEKMRRHLEERRAIRNFQSGRDILDALAAGVTASEGGRSNLSSAKRVSA